MTILYKTAPLIPIVTRDSDVTLLEAARQMDRSALVKIFDLYSTALYNYALRLCNDALIADYIVGDVFAKLLEQLSAGKGPSSNLRSYLYEMTYHLVVDEARYSNRGVSFEVVEYIQQDGYSNVISLENRILYDAILKAVQNDLTEDQRHVIILRFLEGFSLQETATIIGKAVSNVKVIQNRAVSALRKSLDHQVVK
jgi:RNA polymerase sigma-70 factor (ECF subfamily)